MTKKKIQKEIDKLSALDMLQVVDVYYEYGEREACQRYGISKEALYELV